MTVDALARYRRTLLMAVVPLSALAIAPRSFDPVALPKLAVAWAVALLAGGVSVVLWRALPRVRRPRALAVPAALAFLACASVAAMRAENFGVAIIGRSGRAEGLLLYTAGVGLFLAARQAFADDDASSQLLRLLALTGGIVAAYGLLQRAGIDPFGFKSAYSPAIATMGNPNFLSGYTACAVPAAAAVVLEGNQRFRTRAWAAVAGAAALAASVLTGSLQGPVAAAAGLAVLVAVWRLRTVSRRGLLLGVVAASGAVPLAATTFGDTLWRMVTSSLQARLWYWRAAWEMFADHPIVGVGMAAYADYFRAYRPIDARLLGSQTIADAPHSVPIGMFAQGGMLLGLSYLVFLGATAWAAVRLWRRNDGNRLVYGGLLGVWIAYLVQSFVSFDLPSHVVVHWVVAGAIVGMAELPTREPAVTPAGAPKRRKRSARIPATHVAASVMVAAVLFVPAGLSLRANSAAGRAARETRAGNGASALQAWDDAVSATPWDPVMWAQRGRLLAQAKRRPQAAASYREALERNSRSVAYLVTSARLAADMDLGDEAEGLYRRAVALDPTAPEILAEAAQFSLDSGNPQRARELGEQIVRLVPDEVGWWIMLARIRAADGDRAAATDALNQAEQISPGNTDVMRVREELQRD